MNISHFKNKNIHLVECENWQDVYGYEKSEMKEDIINYIEQLQQENQKYKEVIDKAIEFTNKNWGTWCTHRLEYMTELQDILKEVE